MGGGAPRQRAGPPSRSAALGLVALLATGVWTNVDAAGVVEGAMKPLSGEYGFLTKFDNITEDGARRHVRQMVSLFHIREFQFYDAVRGYSEPPTRQMQSWHCKAFERPVQRNILKAYIDEIRRQGGRSWLYLQAAATDPGDSAMQQGFALAGQHVVDGKPLLDAVAPNRQWALKIAPQWADFAADMGFSGIHWDTLGKFSPVMQTKTDLPGFLRAAKTSVVARGLEQTANFVDGFGWDPKLIADDEEGGRTISFPYWETWTLPAQEDFFYQQVVPGPRGGGVFVCYPGKTAGHKGEWQNQAALGIWPLDLMILRWMKARASGNAYLAIGDGIHHIETQYFPANSPISKDDVAKIRLKVFKEQTTAVDFDVDPRPTSLRSGQTSAAPAAAAASPAASTPAAPAAAAAAVAVAKQEAWPPTPRPAAPTPALPWACEAGLDNWAIQTQWSPAKIKWCCDAKQIGCFATPAPTRGRASSPAAPVGAFSVSDGTDGSDPRHGEWRHSTVLAAFLGAFCIGVFVAVVIVARWESGHLDLHWRRSCYAGPREVSEPSPTPLHLRAQE